MKLVIETPEDARLVKDALRVYEYRAYGWQYFARNNGKIEGIRCHRFLENSSLQEAKDAVELFLKSFENYK